MTIDTTRPQTLRPGLFGVAVSADNRRNVFDSHNESLIAEKTPIDAVFIGDSITEMWELPVFFGGRTGLIVNRGIGGDRTTYVRKRLAADVRQLRPNLMVMNIGVNNTWDMDIGLDLRGPLSLGEHIEADVLTDIRAMVDEVQTEGIRVVLGSILPTDIPSNVNSAARNRLIARMNERLHGLAVEKAIVWVDYHREMVADDGLTLRPGLADDGLHPHVVGYRVMARTLLDTLRVHGVDEIGPATWR